MKHVMDKIRIRIYSGRFSNNLIASILVISIIILNKKSTNICVKCIVFKS